MSEDHDLTATCDATNTVPHEPGKEKCQRTKSTKRGAAFPGKSQFRYEKRASSGTFHGHVTHSSVFRPKNEEDGRAGRTWLLDPLPSHGAYKKPRRTDSNRHPTNQRPKQSQTQHTITTHTATCRPLRTLSPRSTSTPPSPSSSSTASPSPRAWYVIQPFYHSYTTSTSSIHLLRRNYAHTAVTLQR
jgi:hypothetical protein